MKFHYTYLVLLFTFSSLFGQLELNSQNKLKLNSAIVPGSDFTIGVDDLQGGIIINSFNTSNIGITGFSLNGNMNGYSGFDHNKLRYNIDVGGMLRLGVTAEATSIFNLLKTSKVHIDEELLVGTSTDTLFRIDANTNRMYFNYDQDIGSSDFVLNSKHTTGYGGMYINSEDMDDGKPFYGYSIDGSATAYHYFNNTNDKWYLNVNNAEMIAVGSDEAIVGNDFKVANLLDITPTFHVETGLEKHLFFNSDTKIGQEDFTLNSSHPTEWGGMYINSMDTELGKPFYGYGINNIGKVYHYFDANDDYWKLHNQGVILEVNNKELSVNGSIRIANVIGTQPEGTIYYNGVNFYGITSGGVIEQLNNTTNFDTNSNDSSFTDSYRNKLESENIALRKSIENLEKRLANIEKVLANSKKQ